MISVAVCTFNGEKYIEKQINSILRQTRQVDEIIVADDGSKDRTVQILRKVLEKGGIKYQILVNQNNLGVTANFEQAMRLCSGDILFTCDQDDVWKEDKVERFMKAFEAHPDVSLVFSDGELIDGNDQPLNTTIWTKINFEADRDLTFEQLLKFNVVTGSAMAVKRELVDRALPIPREWLHDGWLAVVSYAAGGLHAVSEPSYYYRIHQKNVVGVGASNFCGRLSHWKALIEKMPEIYHIKYERYHAVWERFGEQLSREERRNLQACVAFWERLQKNSRQKKGRALLEICKLGLSGDYRKYYTGFRGWMRDMLYVVCRR